MEAFRAEEFTDDKPIDKRERLPGKCLLCFPGGEITHSGGGRVPCAGVLEDLQGFVELPSYLCVHPFPQVDNLTGDFLASEKLLPDLFKKIPQFHK